MKVSLLLPVAISAVLSAASFAIPDDNHNHHIKKVGFDSQAPISSDDKLNAVIPVPEDENDDEPHKHHGHGKHCHKKLRLRPQFVLREQWREFDDGEPAHIDLASVEGSHPFAFDPVAHQELDPTFFLDFYRSPGGYHRHHKGHRKWHKSDRKDDHKGEREGEKEGPQEEEGHEHHDGDEGYHSDHHHGHHGHHEHAEASSEHGEDFWPPNRPSWRSNGPLHGPPLHGPSHEPSRRPPSHWPPKWPGKKPGQPRRPPHHRVHHRHDATIWQLISKSNYTTKFAELVSEHEDLVAVLNGTLANYTIFVPTNKAFEKIRKPKDWKPPKEFIKNLLTYHISNEPFPAFKLLLSHTIPSALDAPNLGGAQRLRVGLGPGGLRVNFYSRIIAANIFASNGVIHGVDSILIPPPPIPKIIGFFPSKFSTLTLAFHLTNLSADIPHHTTGATFFAPPNEAFQKLGPKINAFLFSPWGRKYLKALLKYHIVVNETLYSDAYYHPTPETATSFPKHRIPKGKYHVDLPTILDGKHLSIDISRFGGLINIVINAASTVHLEDVVAKDGVIQVVNNILIPPKKPPTGGFETAEAKAEFEEKTAVEDLYGLTVEEFVERFQGLVEEDEIKGEYKEEDIISMW
ncbi:Stabilin-2 [Arthrobotrys entomopaga]|nr:Stabilin-2 [Arthrobotrys entomopaga]